MSPAMRKLRTLAILGLALAALLFVAWFVFGKQIGEECNDNLECFGLSSMCVDIKHPRYRICTRTCDVHSDCPEGWTCADTPLFDKQEVSLRMKKICMTRF